MGTGTKVLLSAGLALGVSAQAAQLPSGLTTPEVQRTVEVLGFGTVDRSLLTAETLGIEPGIRVGMTQSMIVTHDLKKLGVGDASLPEVVPLPSLQIAKGLPWDIDLQATLTPGKVLNYYESYGGSVGWTYLSERDFDVALSVRPHFTYSNMFSGDYSSWNWGVDFGVSKDFVTWAPYAHIGFAMSDGCVRESLVVAGEESCQGAVAGVGAVGVKLNLPLTIVAQIDTHNLEPGISLFIGKDF
jgi:hypothetical protein